MSGIIFRKAEMSILEKKRTTVAAAPIPRAFITLVEVARVGQVPRTSTKTGFSFIIPFVKFERAFKIYTPFALSKAAKASPTAFLYAFEEIVAPDIASTEL